MPETHISGPSITAPVALYRDPAVFERERVAIFARTWQFLGLEADLVRTGDYLAEVLAGYPLLVIRDEAGALRGYHNVCRHRAGPLVGDTKGRCARGLVCGFHAWRYGFDGQLKDAAGFGPAEGFDPADYGLFPVRVETWRGFVFVNADLAASPLADLLAPLDTRLGEQPRRPARLRDRHLVASNWKVFVERYLDGHRQDGAHPSLAAHPSPDALAHTHRHDVRMHGEVALGEAGARPEEGLWAWIWPNLGFSIYRGVLLLEHLRPDGPDRTLIDHVFLHEPEDPGVDAAIHNAERISEEDAAISERVQRNLDAGIFSRGVLSPTHEQAVAWFQARVARALLPFSETGTATAPPS